MATSAIGSSFNFTVRHQVDTSLVSRQKGIDCVHNSFDRIHRYVTGMPMPLWHHEEFTGLAAYKNAFTNTMTEIGTSEEEIASLIKQALAASNQEEETYQVFKKYLIPPKSFILDDNQLFFVLDLDRELMNTEWDVFNSDSETVAQKYRENPEFINGRYLLTLFQKNLDEELAATRRKIQYTVRNEVLATLDPDEEKDLAAVRARQSKFVFLSPNSNNDKIAKILMKTPIFAAGQLVKTFKEEEWGGWEDFRCHATVIVGSHAGQLVVCDPVRPDHLRFEDPDEFLSRADKLYYYKV